MELEKTQVFHVDGQSYVVSELPLGFRQRFSQLDYMRKHASEKAIEAEAAMIGLNVATMQMQEMIRQRNANEAKKTEGASAASEKPANDA